MNNDPIYRTEVMVTIGTKNLSGIIDLFEDKCIVYDSQKILDEFDYDILHTEIEMGDCEVSFLNLYTKNKEFLQLVYEGKRSPRYFLKDYRAELFIGKFEQRKAEAQNYRIVLRAFELGYTGSNDDKNKVSPKNCLPRKPESLKQWEDLLTPIEWRDYYHSLTRTGKKVYEAILNGIIECKKYVYIDGIQLQNNAVGIIYHYILWDNPAIFCIGEYAMWRAVETDGKHVKITSLCGTEENEKSLRKEVLNSVVRILSHPGLYEYSDIQKEKYIHDYIVRNWPYDLTCGNGGARLEPYTVYGALVQGTAVCEGFAKTTKLLLDILGVHTQVLSGKVKSMNAGHSWNTVRIAGKAYHLDTTSDIGQTGRSKYPIRYDYFNVADEDLIDRVWDDPHVVWKCSSQDHSYPACIGGLINSQEDLQKYLFKDLKKRRPYLYIKVSGPLADKDHKAEWIHQQYLAVNKMFALSSRAVVIHTDIKNLYVISVRY